MTEGWIKSFYEQKPVDKQGNPIPWWTYSCIYFLEKRINNNLTVFEYGSGYSTIWLSERVKKVISVEHDLRWLNKINKIIPQNVKIFHKDCEKGYEKEILNHGLFDMVIIDGINRVKCAKFAIHALNHEGIIVWDDRERDKYKEGIEKLKSYGFKEICFTGLKPVNKFINKTSIMYRDNNCLKIK
ncbi:MAG: hypothetical protein K9L17_12495 [Clostridiales bacterium]|nr:hypothetical protein [Clostridiales bacterium]MCF8023501.1 hypothetical protein [Clostridiales bacterium]